MTMIARALEWINDARSFHLGTHNPDIRVHFVDRPATPQDWADAGAPPVSQPSSGTASAIAALSPSPAYVPIQPALEALAAQIIANRQTRGDTMSTSPVVPVVHLTFLQKCGKILKTALHIGEEAAVVAEPLVIAEFPAIAPIYTSAIGLAISAEATATSATGTGTAKLADVVTKLTPMAEAFATQNGLTFDQSKVEKWTSAIVDTLNLAPFGTK